MDGPIQAMREAAAEAARLTMRRPPSCVLQDTCISGRCRCAQDVADAALIAGLRALPSNIVLAQSTGPVWLGARPAIFFSKHQLEWLASAIEAASDGGAGGPGAATVAPEPPV